MHWAFMDRCRSLVLLETHGTLLIFGPQKQFIPPWFSCLLFVLQPYMYQDVFYEVFMGIWVLVALVGLGSRNGRKRLQDLTMQSVFPATCTAGSWWRRHVWRSWAHWCRRERRYSLIVHSYRNTWLTLTWMLQKTNNLETQQHPVRTSSWVKLTMSDTIGQLDTNLLSPTTFLIYTPN